MLEVKLVQESEVADEHGQLSAGQQLRNARISLGWQVADVADRLNLPESYIHFLEKDEYSKLPGATFSRGYLNAYAKCLELPAGSISAAYAEQTTLQESKKKVGRIFKVNRGEKAGESILMWTSIVIIVLCLVLSLSWWQNRSKGDDVSAVVNENVSIKTADGREIIANLMAFPNRQPPGLTEPVDASRIIEPTGITETPTPPVKPVAEERENVLELIFADSSWIEIKDVNGQMLFTGVKKVGEPLLLKNISLFDIVIGNANAVKLSYNSAPVDLGSYANAKNVARLTLGG
jgi:cytoskeleton protein RodZ